MRFRRLLPLLLAAAAPGLSAQPARAPAFHVATTGSDDAPGTIERPFATLARARDAVRALRPSGAPPSGGATVWIHGGTYPLTATFRLGAEDSGAPDAPVVYRAADGESVRLTGGRDILGFKPVEDPAILARLDEAARGKVVQADLRAQGVADFGAPAARGFGRPMRPAAIELFFQGKPMTPARWPNEGWAKIADVPDGPKGGKFAYEGDRPKRWSASGDIWLHGYWTWDWADSYEKAASIDPEKRIIATVPPHGVYGYKKGGRFRALNILEELDEPGEWVLDRASGVLYFWPPGPVAEGRAEVSLIEKPMVEIDGASHVELRGIAFECARGMAVRIAGGERVVVAGCAFRNLGTIAVEVAGGTSHTVSDCAIEHTGEGGVVLTGGDRATLAPAGHAVLDCRISDFSRTCRTYRPAVHVSGVGNRVAHNRIHDAPHSAIILHGNDHVVEFNEIHHVCLETHDAGAFYIGRDWTERGNIVRFNHFHDLGRGDVNAIYLDDWTSGTTVYGNLCVRAGRGVLIGGGRDNRIENNVFVECSPAVHLDARGRGWAKHFFDGHDNTLFDRFKAIHADRPPYSTRYPPLATLLQDEPAMPKGNAIVRNICRGGRWLDLHDGLKPEQAGLADNLTDADPLFMDPESGDYRLKPESPALKLGFKPLPLDEIGPRRGGDRR